MLFLISEGESDLAFLLTVIWFYNWGLWAIYFKSVDRCTTQGRFHLK